MNYFTNHLYTLGSTGYKVKNELYTSREDAKREMYRIIDKRHLHVVKKYDDVHSKTYICEGGIEFYINRV